MEPVFMVLGQSAGIAAVISIRDRLPVQNIPYQEFEKILLSSRAFIHLPDTRN
jgi:hypothetical protein